MESRLNWSSIADERHVDVLAATARAAIEWAWAAYPGRVCALCSMQDAVVVDLVMQVDQRIPVVFLDTGHHFAETLDAVRRVEDRYGIRVERVMRPGPVRPDVEPGECCAPKSEMLDTALAERDAWITGLQRSETASRADAEIIGTDRRGAVKISPLAQWSDQDRRAYIDHHDVITHPLLAAGYDSIGCAPCTARPTAGARSGRWPGTERTECGLHL